ncbi:uncharacterized protein N7459_006592 [Penicillium hispanicum]|uniref:uncharacterized protein n=1 Tax=Penicillium hispanicum TaxID=1080232 RepID=UPI002542420C|nr:uncharacterized protein N7459_006592 [Penicillium hispanicum]KAJ5577628.1 hypothetical protein N7459_006592 [Penicillium hispanicum]
MTNERMREREISVEIQTPISAPSSRPPWRKGPPHRPYWKGRKIQDTAPPAPPPPLGEILAEIRPSDLKEGVDNASHVLGITNSQYLASYNWPNGKDRRIIVPGEPPIWTPPIQSKLRLRQDTGDYYRDQDVDVVGCRNTLGNLLRFARGDARQFRIVMRAVGRTVFFMRGENSPTEIIRGRIMDYEFAGFKLLVRFEVDGFLPSLVSDDGAIPEPSPLRNAAECESQALSLEKDGRRIPQRAVFDLKTRSIRKKTLDILDEMLPRLLVAQIPNFVVAYHTFGTESADDIAVHDVREELARWERSNQPLLARFRTLLQVIVSLPEVWEMVNLKFTMKRVNKFWN